MTSNESPDVDPRAAELRLLAQAAAAGDEEAFVALHGRLSRGLQRFLSKRLRGDAEVTEELAQRAWAQVWQALRRGVYDPQRAAVSTFVYSVAYHVWLQHCRDSGRLDRTAGDADALLRSIEGGDAGPEGQAHMAELLDALRACMQAAEGPNALTDEERLVAARLAAGERERGLAEELGIAASTVHARKSSAFEKLRRCLRAKGFRDAGPERGAT